MNKFIEEKVTEYLQTPEGNSRIIFIRNALTEAYEAGKKEAEYELKDLVKETAYSEGYSKFKSKVLSLLSELETKQ